MGLLWAIVAIPLVSALVLAVLGARCSRKVVTALGVGSIGLSAVITMLVATGFVTASPAGMAYREVLWTWISVAAFQPHIALYLDALSLVMILVVTFVGFLIHLYSAEFMEDEEGFCIEKTEITTDYRSRFLERSTERHQQLCEVSNK